MRRRGVLLGAGTGVLSLIAGCTSDTSPSNSTESPQDSDGDGVPDKDDYAPNDPDVQSKSDIPTPTISPTNTPFDRTIDINTPTPTPSPSPTPTSTPVSRRTNTIQADNGPLVGFSHHPVEYSAEHATVRVYGDSLDNNYRSGAELMALVVGYPESSQADKVFSYHRSSTFTPPSWGDTTMAVNFDSTVNANGPFFYTFLLVPSGTDYSSIDGNNTDFLCETDRLRIRNGSLSRSRHPDEPRDDSTRRYSRQSAEGCYVLNFSGTTFSRNWDVGFLVFKHRYIEEINGQRYRDRRYYVYEALDDGFADEFGHILNDEAEANGITGDREKVEFLINFVQNLPYIPDDVSTGYDDYTKRHVETIIDGGGDCEDSAIMLASLLLSEPFNYGTALLILPGAEHAALGVKGGDNIDGYYYENDGTRYYYIETTGRGWSVGEIPDEFRNEQAYVRVF